MASTPLETELKVPVESLGATRRALEDRGASLVTPMTREENCLLDWPDGRLGAAGNVLRLRRYGEKRMLTFKGSVSYDGPMKIRPEWELGVEALTPLQDIFTALGCTVVARYEKDRETWRLDDVEIVLDHTPMGDFVEVEGPAGVLEMTARSIGLDPSAAVRGSYISLWRAYRERAAENLPVDMVFGS